MQSPEKGEKWGMGLKKLVRFTTSSFSQQVEFSRRDNRSAAVVDV
jgi:hypothetical protein